MGPILVQFGVPPQVSSATTATTLVVLATSTLLVYICRGIAPVDYSICLSLCAMAGAMTGKVLIGWWVRKTGKQSFIVWALAGVTLLSTLLLGISGILEIQQSDGRDFQTKLVSASTSFRNFCPGYVTIAVPAAD